MFAERLGQWGWRFAFGVVGKFLPTGLLRRTGYVLGTVLFRFGIRRSVALQNIRLAFPELSPDQVQTLARRALQSLATVYLEIPKLRHLTDAQLRRFLTVENLELLTSIDERGALLLSGHVGNWELLALGAAWQSGHPFAIVVKGQKDFGELNRTRTSRGNTTIPLHRSALQSSRILAAGGVVAMLADQSAPEREPLVELFGIPTRAYTAPAKLALRYRPRVIVGFALREADRNSRVSLQQLEYDDLEDTPEGVLEFTQRYLNMLESAVREHPEQWVWGHRRWKNSPGVRYD